ncbi:MAG TPA: LysM peptidoglycan-binding domain-containing protein [Candidatus Limnocylindrales bacterium]
MEDERASGTLGGPVDPSSGRPAATTADQTPDEALPTPTLPDRPPPGQPLPGQPPPGQPPPEPLAAIAGDERDRDALASQAEHDAIAEASAAVAAATVADPSAICPFLRRVDAEGGLFEPHLLADDANRCAALEELQPQSIRQQELVCLDRAYLACPRYLRGAVARSRAADVTEHRISRPVVVAAMILVASIAASGAFVLARGGISLPSAVLGEGGPSPTAGAVASPPGQATATAPTGTGPVTPVPSVTSPAPTPASPATVAPAASASAPPTRQPATPAPTARPKPTANPTSNRYAYLVACPDRPDCYIYTVRAGDNLRSIANWFGVSYDTVLRLNPAIVDPALIRKGDPIALPPPTR